MLTIVNPCHIWGFQGKEHTYTWYNFQRSNFTASSKFSMDPTIPKNFHGVG